MEAPLSEKIRFQKIDGTNIQDHYHLSPDDECYFLFEYTAGKGYSFSETNNLISNLKKKPSRREAPDYKYKLSAIDKCAAYIRLLNPKWLEQATLVPVPPSKIFGDPEYDPRIEEICKRIPARDVRSIVVQTRSLVAAHETSSRPTVEDLLAVYAINESVWSLHLRKSALSTMS